MLIRSLILMAAAGALVSAAPGAGDSVSPGQAQLIEDLRVLSADDMQGRQTGTPGAVKARAYLIERMRAIGLEPAYASFEQAFAGKLRDGTEYTGTNLVARIAGTGKSDRVLVVGAHYDHLGVRDGAIFNGADDNASGVAAALAIAQAFKNKPPKHDVIIALWDAEERGLVGAKAFIAAPPVPLARIALNLNLDMIGRDDKGALWVAGASHYPALRLPLERLAADAPVPLKLGHDGPPWKGSDDWTFGSDHGAFHAVGIPFAYFGVEDHDDHHRPTDDFDKIDREFFARATATVINAARLFDDELDSISSDATSRK